LQQMYVKHTGQTYEAVDTALERDNFMSADEAKAWGLIDEVYEKRPDSMETTPSTVS
jgi:ATP-dependent Clp protease, protease subunit